MPIYEYNCSSCSHQFEKLMSSSSVKNPECPECGKTTEKLLSTFAATSEGSCCGGESGAGSSGSCCSGGSCGCH
jgi:putative FmdB family regulatory protein